MTQYDYKEYFEYSKFELFNAAPVYYTTCMFQVMLPGLQISVGVETIM